MLLTAMEYLREDVAEKEEETKSSTPRIGIIVVEESSEETKTSTQDNEVSQPIEGWSKQEMKVSWVDRIKTIGK